MEKGQEPAKRPGLPRAQGWRRVLTIIVAAGCLALSVLDLGHGPMRLPVDPSALMVLAEGGARAFRVEIARTESERDRGLMFRADMPDDHGMLFVFSRAQTLRFWMKYTPIPLDIMFIGEAGRVNAIRYGSPGSETVVTSDGPARYVLEVKAGTAAREGIGVGDRIEHPAIERRLPHPSMLAPSSAWTSPPSTVRVSPTM